MKSTVKPSTSASVEDNQQDSMEYEENIGNSSQDNNEQTSTVPTLEENDCCIREYAGIDIENIRFYAEHEQYEEFKDLPEEACSVLAEDINYKLRLIIYESITRARLTGRNVITADDVDESFSALGINKVLGAPNLPIWVNYGNQNLLSLDDVKVNLVEIAESDQSFAQCGDVCLTQEWHEPLENSSKIFRNYFKMTCEMIVNPDSDLRNTALTDISENPKIGPIAEWFYNFGYLLLAQDIKYKDLTLFALELMETLENSPITSMSAPDKLLKLLVQLIIQRLLNETTDVKVLQPMASVLATLCIRPALFQLTIDKLHKKLIECMLGFTLMRILLIVNALGTAAICRFFLPNMDYILELVEKFGESDLEQELLVCYGLMCKEKINDTEIQNKFTDIFGDVLLVHWRPVYLLDKVPEKEEMDFIRMKVRLMKNRRKLDPNAKSKKYTEQKMIVELRKKKKINGIESHKKVQIREVFEIPEDECTITKKLQEFSEEYNKNKEFYKKDSSILVGETTLLLPVLNQKRKKLLPKCLGHCLIMYNF